MATDETRLGEGRTCWSAPCSICVQSVAKDSVVLHRAAALHDHLDRLPKRQVQGALHAEVQGQCLFAQSAATAQKLQRLRLAGALQKGGAEVGRQAVEGVALASANVLKRVRELNVPVDHVVTSGGYGKNRLWLQAALPF